MRLSVGEAEVSDGLYAVHASSSHALPWGGFGGVFPVSEDFPSPPAHPQAITGLQDSCGRRQESPGIGDVWTSTICRLEFCFFFGLQTTITV